MSIRAVHRLSPAFVRKTRKEGMHCDGGNLYLQVTHGAAGNVRRSWVFRYQLPGRRPRDMGLGPLADTTLAEVREVAREYRKMLAEGLDPIDVRRAKVAQNLAATAMAMSFDQCAEQYMAAHESGWSAIHSRQWHSTIKADVSPVIGKIDVRLVDTPLVVKTLERIWSEKPVSAGRLRGRIEAVLGWAKARGYRDGENPARWKGHLENLLAKLPGKGERHFAALAYDEVPAFMGQLRKREGHAALLLEWIILTASRVGEATGATWGEIDLSAKLWTIAGDRMKAGRQHRVPLPAAALAVLERMRDHWGSTKGLIFADPITGRPVSDKTLGRLIRSIGAKVTTHGFRSSFRDWCGDKSSFPREVVEAALAHQVGDQVEQAYRRSTAEEKRRRLMTAWSEFCGSEPATAGAKVVSIR
jgi:integrase